MGAKDVYNVSFVGGKLHILRGTFEMRREIKHKFVPLKRMRPCFHYSRVYSGPYNGYIPLYIRHDPGTNIALSYCFEELCARSTAEKPHGTFFSVVTRKIGELNVIMAGEVDCSLSMHYDQSIVDSSLTPHSSKTWSPAWRTI